jgi:hypothetical protein
VQLLTAIIIQLSSHCINAYEAQLAQKEADWNVFMAEVRAERVAFTQWDVRVQEMSDAEQTRVTAAREAAADAMETGISEHMRGNFSITCLETRGAIPLQLSTATQAFADGPPKTEASQVIRVNVANLSAGGPVLTDSEPIPFQM